MIKKYNEFITESNESIESICKKYEIENYTINEDGTVDVDGDVLLNDLSLYTLPLNFGEVSGSFDCSGNQLTTLKNSPKKVGGYFDCSRNQLTTLEGSPQIVGNSYLCYSNKLISLKGSPQKVSGYFDCCTNKLTTLEEGPQSVGGDFQCSDNELITLEGSPQSIDGCFNCSYNQLTTLEGGPKRVGGYFDCSSNHLETLKGAPESVGGDFYNCTSNLIKDFIGFPDFWEGSVNFNNNPVYVILFFFPIELQSKAIYYINEFDAIHDGKIIPERLEEVFYELELPVPKEIYTLKL